jgi:hypothetical protein
MISDEMEGNVNESYYLCEGLWLDKKEKKLIDRNNEDKKININNIENKIYIFSLEIKEWIFHPMNILLDNDKNNKSEYKPFKNSIFVLYGIFSYLEKIERYKSGATYKENDSKSTKILTFSFKKIFKTKEDKIYGNDKIENILNTTRNSLMHTGNIGEKILINNDYLNINPVEYIGSNKELRKIELNPTKMFEKIKEDFNNYLEKLNNSNEKELRKYFEKVFNNIYSDEIKFLNE